MIDSFALLADLKAQLKLLQADLKQRADDPSNPWGARLKEEYAEAFRRERTGWSWGDWRDNEVDQAAVAWIISTTFLRFCEDNDLLVGATIDGLPTAVGWIAGPGDRVQRAEENLTAYFRDNPTNNRRHWLQQGFAVLAAQPAGQALVDPKHNPVWRAEISPESATALMAFWRRTNEDGSLVHDFKDPDLETRFLGDLYQDLSEHARDTYALLQTPVFVEEFILDQTLTPAVAEFGLDGLKLIDPACGSGHFLLGAFERLNHAWLEAAPGLDAKERVRRAMASIHGVDVNPFAAAIARFRLTVAGLKAAGERSLVGVPAMGFRLAIGDSLLGIQGGLAQTIDYDEDDAVPAFSYATEDLDEYFGILQPGKYHVVVGNPPYIAPKDKALKALYRLAYVSAHGRYALSAPFMELLFRLAIRGEQRQGGGYVGQITSNSFMKREFGKKLIEHLFAGHDIANPVDLTAVIDTSGAYIPGHGTPTVIIVGRRRRPVADRVRAVLGVRGEPGQPANPSKGLVWTQIIEHFDTPGYDGSYVTVAEVDRSTLTVHPWSLSGGGAGDLKQIIEAGSARTLKDMTEQMGITAVTGEDGLYLLGGGHATERLGVARWRALVEGDMIRDYSITGEERAIWPYDDRLDVIPFEDLDRGTSMLFSGYRAAINRRRRFGTPMVDRGLAWWEWQELYRDKLLTPLSIAFAEVATHNQFVLSRESRVFKNSASVIKLPASASDESYVALLGLLNSSTACFWLKQVCHNKGSTVDSKGARQTQAPWEDFYAFNSTRVGFLPLPTRLPESRGHVLDQLANDTVRIGPKSVVAAWLVEPTRSLAEVLKSSQSEWLRLRARMVFEQEELDWEVYRLYGLIGTDFLYSGSTIESVELGQRTFEIAMARDVEAGTEEMAWFERHGSTPNIEMPASWPDDYRAVVQRRLALIESDRNVSLLEQPQYKRRWATTAWSVQRTEALRAAILDRLEDPSLWKDPQGPVTRSVAEIADLLRADAVLKELAQEFTGDPEPSVTAVISSLALDEAVPFLATYRYKPTGVEKYRAWQNLWALQQREDAGEKVVIPVPRKYGQRDFAKASYWRARGPLDVAKERFVAYPGVVREADPTPVLGWAGWSHRDRALALAREIPAQQALGADDAALLPLVAGLVELEPWLAQWYSDVEPQFGTSPASVISGVVDQYLARMEKTRDQVTAWTPPVATRGRRAPR